MGLPFLPSSLSLATVHHLPGLCRAHCDAGASVQMLVLSLILFQGRWKSLHCVLNQFGFTLHYFWLGWKNFIQIHVVSCQTEHTVPLCFASGGRSSQSHCDVPISFATSVQLSCNHPFPVLDVRAVKMCLYFEKNNIFEEFEMGILQEEWKGSVFWGWIEGSGVKVLLGLCQGELGAGLGTGSQFNSFFPGLPSLESPFE